jgi:Phage-related minor tail protein
MANQVLSFDIIGTAASAAAAFQETADTSELAARGARACAIALEREGAAANASIDATLSLARADAILADAGESLTTSSIEQDAALRQRALAADEVAAADERAAGSSREMGASWLKYAMGLAAVGFGAFEAVKSAASFQAQMTMLNTQAGVSKTQLAGLGAGVLKLAGQVGENPDSLAESLYHVESNFASLGIKAPKALDDVKIAAEGARVGNADLVDVTNALTAALASQIPGVQNTSQAMGALNAIVGAGDMHMQDLADAFGTGMVAVVKGYGLSLTDVGAALDVFGDNNIRGAKAGTDLRMAVQALAVPVATAGPELAKLGLTANSLAEAMQRGGLMGALDMLQARFVKTGVVSGATSAKIHADILKYGIDSKQVTADLGHEGEEITAIFGKKAGAGLAVLLEQMERLRSKYPAITKGAKDFGDAWETTQATLSQKFADLRGTFDAVVTTIGLKLIPVVSDLASFVLTSLIPAISSVVGWMDRNKTVVEAVAIGIGAALVPAIIAWGVAAATAAIETIAAAAPLIAIGVVVAGLAFGILELARHWHQVWTDIKHWTDDAWHFIYDGFGKYLLPLLGPAGLLALGAIELAKHWHQVWTDIKQWTGDAVDWIRTHLKLLGEIVATVLLGPIGGLAVFVATHWGQIERDTAHLVSDVTGWFRRLPGDILHALGDFGHLLWNAGASLLHGLIGGITSEVGNVIHSVASVGSSILSTVESALGLGSPSRITRQHGMWVAQGLAMGMTDGLPLVRAASLKLSAAALGSTTHGATATPAIAIGAGGGASTYVINNYMQVGTSPAEVGRQIVEDIRAFERGSGTSWRTGQR